MYTWGGLNYYKAVIYKHGICFIATDYSYHIMLHRHMFCTLLEFLTFWRRNYFFFNFSTACIQNVNNTGTKYVRIMKQTAF